MLLPFNFVEKKKFHFMLTTVQFCLFIFEWNFLLPAQVVYRRDRQNDFIRLEKRCARKIQSGNMIYRTS